MIELRNIKVEFDHNNSLFKAVNDVSLKIEKGDIFGIVGFSGAGKSTLVRTINLLQRPTEGQVLVRGEDITLLSEKNLREKRKKIGMIFQHFNLMNSRSIFENVAYPLKKSSLSKKEKEERVMNLLKLVDISEKAESYPSQLSGGQKQRVAIARALANEPDILLCDEATSALDPQTTGQILNLLKKLNEELNLTIVIITHEMLVVKEICNKVAVMDSGKVIEKGDVFEVFAKPKEEVTIKFINSVNREDELLKTLSKLKITNNLNENRKLFKIVYVGDISQEPMITEIYRKFEVVSNIIWGNIEIINNKPIGNLALVMEGNLENINLAVEYLKSKGVEIEEIKIKDEEGVKLC